MNETKQATIEELRLAILDAVRMAEGALANLPGQHAGIPRLRELRDAVRTLADRAAGLEKELEEERGVEGRCPIGHHKRLTTMLDGKPVCVACERDSARQERDDAERRLEEATVLETALRGQIDAERDDKAAQMTRLGAELLAVEQDRDRLREAAHAPNCGCHDYSDIACHLHMCNLPRTDHPLVDPDCAALRGGK